MTRAIADGLSWRRFWVLLTGLSSASVWGLVRSTRKAEPVRLEGAAIDAYFASMS